MPKKGKRNKVETEKESQKQFVKTEGKTLCSRVKILTVLNIMGLNRCPDKGINAYLRYAGIGILAYNLHKIGNFLIKTKTEEAKESGLTEAGQKRTFYLKT